MESARLEQLEAGLREVLRLIERDESPASADRNAELSPEHPAVRAAGACELMLPEHLTLDTLAETARHKIDTVQVLLERAREHESLPPSAQLAADEGYIAGLDELEAGKLPADS